MMVNAASSTVFSVAKFIWSRLKHMFTVTFEITSRDESYGWMIEWLNAHPLSQHAPSISVTSTYYEYDEGDKRPKLLLVPNVGAHMLKYRGCPIWLSRTKEENYPDLLANGTYTYQFPYIPTRKIALDENEIPHLPYRSCLRIFGIFFRLILTWIALLLTYSAISCVNKFDGNRTTLYGTEICDINLHILISFRRCSRNYHLDNLPTPSTHSRGSHPGGDGLRQT